MGKNQLLKLLALFSRFLAFQSFHKYWCVPEALITAELSTSLPGNGGYIIWTHKAFGPFWGSLMGSWKFLTSVINLSAFPILCVAYLEKLFPIFEDGLPRLLAIFILNTVLAFICITGIDIVGYASIVLGVVSLAPFGIMSAMATPHIKPHRWLMLLTCIGYIIPLMAVTGATELDQKLWDTGYMAVAAKTIGGTWLKILINIGAVLSAMGLYLALLGSCSFQILGQAASGKQVLEIGVLLLCQLRIEGIGCGDPNHISKNCTKPLVICYGCNEKGHKLSEYPKVNPKQAKPFNLVKEEKVLVPKPKARVYQMGVEEAKSGSDVVTCMILVKSKPARVLYDSGASVSFVSYNFSKELSTPLEKLPTPIEVEIADSKIVVVSNVFRNVEIEIDESIFRIDLIPIMLGEFDIIVAMD
ncbi:amino acid/polyamine transporter I [Artemisia annua]|uniref:Amino acid/polyamine transporter I n=1 Tax=Artemisia annua TaxID=35608 RepID=A0A2U1MGY8_ARTAN|nr:amino acid/polyamine transporter I [Artemisia annua]